MRQHEKEMRKMRKKCEKTEMQNFRGICVFREANFYAGWGGGGVGLGLF